MRRVSSSLAAGAVLLLLALGLSGCPDVAQDPPVEFGYDSHAVAIFNPDWGVIPLANNFLNPAFQAEIPVIIPGAPLPDETPETVALPPFGEEDADKARTLGYPVEADSDLTVGLKAGMNTLDGFVPGFVVKLPFSRPVDMDSLVPVAGKVSEGVLEEGNGDTANFFFMDITDPDNPELIPAKDYFRIFNLELAESYPYYLTLRLTPAMLLPRDFTPGHTYLVVVTGLDEERGLKDSEGNPFWPDSFFLLFNSTDPFVDENGTLRNNLLPDKASIWELEGARQITDYGVKIWEKLVGEGRNRNEIVTAFHFTIASNPKPLFLNPLNAVKPNANPILPNPADYVHYDANWKPTLKKADACLTTPVRFTFNMPVEPDTLDGDSVKLWKLGGPGERTDVAVTLEALEVEEYDAVNDEMVTRTRVTLTPKSALDANTEYLVAVNDQVRGGVHGRRAVDDVYFGLTRVDSPLVDDGQWMSPFLDSRVDTLILNGDIDRITPETLGAAEEGMLRVLNLLEAIRLHAAPYLDALIGSDFAPVRESVTLLFTFTTGDSACGASAK